MTLVSAMLGFPLWTEVRSGNPARISTHIRLCLKIAPVASYIDVQREDLVLKPQSLRGKVVIATGAGLSPSTTSKLHEFHLDKDNQIGYLGVQTSLKDLPGHLVLDLDEDTEAIMADWIQQPSRLHGLAPEVQAAWMKMNLALLG